MEFSVFMWIMISSAIAIGAYIAITNRKVIETKPVLKKSPARYVTVATEEDVQSFMEIYNLAWKPQRDLAGEIPPDI